jgi:hypothetical protein
MARLDVTLQSIRVGTAGEDGFDNNAEWRLDNAIFVEDYDSEGRFLGSHTENFRFTNNSVDDREDFNVNQTFSFENFGPNHDGVILRSFGFEDDPIGDDQLPFYQIALVPNGEPLGDLIVEATGITGDFPEGPPEFTYRVDWQLKVADPDIPLIDVARDIAFEFTNENATEGVAFESTQSDLFFA